MSKDASTATSTSPGGLTRSMFRAGGVIHGFMYRRGMARKMGEMQQVLLTTTGRKSGQPHTVVASGKGYANYTKKTSRVIPLGWLRPV